jgi:hypothetical protein
MRKISIILSLLGVILPLAAQYQTQALHPNIHSLRTRYVDSEDVLQRPVLVLNDEAIDGQDPQNTLEISFDELSHDTRMYSYTVKHLDYDWTN